MTEFQISDHMLHVECEGLAKDIFEEFQREAGADFDPEACMDEMQGRAHEAADGHEWVIYHYKALILCAHCNVDMGEEFLEETGLPETPTLNSIASLIAYGEIMGRTRAILWDMAINFEPAE